MPIGRNVLVAEPYNRLGAQLTRRAKRRSSGTIVQLSPSRLLKTAFPRCHPERSDARAEYKADPSVANPNKPTTGLSGTPCKIGAASG